jgi:predicted nucleic acid-binding protein
LRVVIDTNIFITREDYRLIPTNIQTLISALQKLNAQIVLHPLSIAEVERDKNKERSEIILSKVKTYLTIHEPPPVEADPEFLNIIGLPRNEHESTDANLLFCIYRDAADVLVTEDKGLRRKAEKIGLTERVLSVEDCLDYCEGRLENKALTSPPSIRLVPMHNIGLKDPIFDSLRDDYPEFDAWWKKASREGREAWVYKRQDSSLGAFLVLKLEDESIDCSPPLPRNKRVKICTVKVSEMGHKIGELFIKTAVQYALKNETFEMYLTRFTKNQDELVQLISEFGFYKAAKKNNGEDVYLKRLLPNESVKSPIEIASRFYPSFYDGRLVHKFVIPIRPEYHDRLFTDYRRRQVFLPEYRGRLITEGNTIKKAYLCHSKTRWISSGDLVLFYRSEDEQCITSLGVVEEAYSSSNPNKILEYVGLRTVYNRDEIQDMTRKNVRVIMFTWLFHLPKPLKLTFLQQNDLLPMAPRTIVRITHEKYLRIKEAAGVDRRFAFDSTTIRS